MIPYHPLPLTLTDLVVAALAAWQAVEIWRHSAVMASWRARVELWQSWWLRGLLGCPFCLCPWASLLLVLWLGLGTGVEGIGGIVTVSPVWALAASRLANLGNDLTHRFCRTPRYDTLPEDLDGQHEPERIPNDKPDDEQFD